MNDNVYLRKLAALGLVFLKSMTEKESSGVVVVKLSASGARGPRSSSSFVIVILEMSPASNSY